MNELHLQDKILIPFFREGLSYRKVKANIVTKSSFTVAYKSL